MLSVFLSVVCWIVADICQRAVPTFPFHLFLSTSTETDGQPDLPPTSTPLLAPSPPCPTAQMREQTSIVPPDHMYMYVCLYCTPKHKTVEAQQAQRSTAQYSRALDSMDSTCAEFVIRRRRRRRLKRRCLRREVCRLRAQLHLLRVLCVAG
ncbi:uncharacterized protein J3D65DRAFT_611416 [Phyllosticta citribraziliensis]|uniref:Uncharacterized protein n=1 Tax=Phyllosticta citribraziliensis TaxID=989973 RepID=A0ABR1MAS2_9PEZI